MGDAVVRSPEMKSTPGADTERVNSSLYELVERLDSTLVEASDEVGKSLLCWMLSLAPDPRSSEATIAGPANRAKSRSLVTHSIPDR